MGDIADALIDEGLTLYCDHLAGHPAFPADFCPYCEDEDEPCPPSSTDVSVPPAEQC